MRDKEKQVHMPVASEINYYIDSSRRYFDFLIESKQWSGISKKDLNNWIKNFDRFENGAYLACRILNEAIGYSENDIVRMLEGAISDILNQEIVIPCQKEKQFSEIRSALEYDVKEALDNTLFVPLTVTGAPGESGDAMIRLMTQKFDFTINKEFPDKILEDYQTSRIIIVDDCIGSGEQFTDFWNEVEIQNGKKLRKWCSERNIKVYYVVLVACKETVTELKKNFPECTFVCVELLTDRYKVLKTLLEDGIFASEKEKLESFLSDQRIDMYGFAALDYAVFMNNNIPDWSMPMLYKARLEWQPLLRRKDSNV